MSRSLYKQRFGGLEITRRETHVSEIEESGKVIRRKLKSLLPKTSRGRRLAALCQFQSAVGERLRIRGLVALDPGHRA